jgi:carotenoid cleavage dioxygenase-like enzyme
MCEKFKRCRSSNRLLFEGVVKVNMRAEAGEGEVARIHFPEGTKGGELSFVSRSPRALTMGDWPDDDGWLIGYLTSEDNSASYFVVCRLMNE